MFFKPKQKITDFNTKIKLYGKILYPTESVRYLGAKIDNQLSWIAHINDIAIKLNRANALLFKIRDLVDSNILKSIFHAIFESHINYACIVWGQNINTLIVLLYSKEKHLELWILKITMLNAIFSQFQYCKSSRQN